MARRADDRRAATAAALLAAGLVGQQIAGKAIRDSLFLSTFAVSSLPGMMILSSLVSALAAFVFARAMGRRSPAGVMRLALLAASALFVLEWWLATRNLAAASAAVYLHLAFFGPALVSALWSLVNERFHPKSAKKLVSRIGAGASVGAILGGLLAWLGAGVVGVPAMLLGLAALSACCLAGLPWLQPPEADRERKPSESAPASGLRSLGRYPYLRNLALLVALASLTEVLVDYVFKARTVAWLSGSGALIAFFGPFYTGLAALSLVAQTALTRPALERLGLSSTVALHPLSTALGTAVALAHPGLGSVLLARGATGVLRDSLFRSGYELLYTPLPPRTKRATKALVDVTADKAGAISGAGLALLLIGALPGGGEWALLGLAFVGGLAALIVARRLHAGYVAALGQSLRAGTVHVDLSDALDATTRATLTHALDRDSILAEIDALRAPDAERDVGDLPGEADPLVAAIADVRSGIPSRVRRAIRGVAPGETALVSHLIPLLVRNEVFVESVRYLRSCAPRCTGQLLDALLDPDVDPVVRRRVPRVLKGCPTQRVVDGLLAGLEDPVFSVRAECALVLFHVTGRAPELQVPPEKVFSTVARELASEGGDQRLLGHAFTLLALVLEREPLRIALHAFDSGDRRLRGTALEYLENVLPEEVKHPLWSRVGELPTHASPRPRREVETELLRSAPGIRRSRLGLGSGGRRGEPNAQ